MRAREAVYRILLEVEQGGYANLVVNEFFHKHPLSLLDKGLATEIVYGTIKYQAKLDYIINQLVKKAAKLEKGVQLILRLSFYQLLFLDKVPARAITHEAVSLAKKFYHPGVAGLINGVLRNYLRNPKQIIWPNLEEDPLTFLEINYSHPRWMVDRWLMRYGFANTVKLCEFNNDPADLWVRTNTLRTTPELLIDRLKKEGCEVERSQKVPEGILLKNVPAIAALPTFQEGLFTVQDESSMLVAHFLHPSPQGEVLDVCAGPGGKTTHLAQLMDNQGLILAGDVHEHRLELIEENARRLGITIIKTRLQDASEVALNEKKHYDFILVDAPCSGLGVLRRRPDARWRKKPQDIQDLAQLQLKILESVSQNLAPGGRLIYSTCTIEPEENQQVIENILAKHPELSPLDLNRFVPYQASSEEKLELSKGMRQYLPFKDNLEGFFIAGLEKSPSRR